MSFSIIWTYVIAYFGLFTAIFFFVTYIENMQSIKNPKPRRFPSVSVIVPAYNEEKTIAKTISSLQKLDYPKNKLKIIVVDDGSKDNTAAVVKKIKGVTFLQKQNGGKASAMNFGLEHCNTELVASLDADSFVAPSALKKMVGYFENQSVMAVTPSLKVWKPRSALQKMQAIEYLIGIFLRKAFAFLGGIHVTPGPFSIYRKSFFDKYGYYDTHNLTEDIEIALRIQSKGYDIENSVDAEVFTVAPSKFKPLLKQRVRWYIGFIENVWNYRNLFSLKHNLGAFILPTSFISIAFIIITLFYFIYEFVSRAATYLFNFAAIDFDLIRTINFRIDPFTFNTGAVLMFSLVSLVISLLVLFAAKKLSNEKSKLKFSYLLYFIFYWVFFGIWWSAAFALKL
ncbi:MAG: glycosyltransferase, partial [Candidatus Nanoarchaeia archaeon]